MSRTSFCTSCLRSDGQFVIHQINPTSQTVNQHSLHRNRLTRSDSRIFRTRTRSEWVRNRWRTTPTMSTTKTTVKEKTQPRSAEQQQIICRHSEKSGYVIKECQKFICKEQERQGGKQTIDNQK